MSTKPTSVNELYGVIRRVRPLFRALVTAVEYELRDSAVSVPMRGVLETLQDGGRQTVPQIARELDVKRQFVQRLVDEAIACGLVRHVDNPMHKRSSLFELTREGSRTFAAIRRRENRIIRRASGELSSADVAATNRVLSRMLAGFRQENSRWKG